MVVAAGAADGEPEEATREDIDPVVDDVGRDTEEAPAGGEEPQRGEIRIPRAHDPISGQLQTHEPFVRHVVVERGDHPVAVHRGMDEKPLLTTIDIALGVGVAGDVEPVPPLLFAVARRGEEPVDDFFVGVGGGIGDEGCHLLGLRGQSGEVVRDAADERAAIGLGRSGKPGFGKPGVDESIDERRIERRCRRFAQRLEGPVRSLFLAHRRAGRRRLGPGCPGEDPGLDRCDLAFGEPPPRFRWRHPHLLIGMADSTENL